MKGFIFLKRKNPAVSTAEFENIDGYLRVSTVCLLFYRFICGRRCFFAILRIFFAPTVPTG
ncbi:hypothetical protein [Bacillus sp. FJAT-29814]|uniref:hypothetical protein n=1 Tax=Bacillus sp. FJAT-29814 TaxID=1729688 RepID=UPI0012E3AAF9|nr:hypothetical protein [Bacillus sp. FJAT-29814]